MANQFGEQIKNLRTQENLLQRQVASQLDIDTPLLSKIERGERTAKKEIVSRLAKILKTNEKGLLTLWLADQLQNLAKDEDVALHAMEVAGKSIKNNKKQ